MFDNYSIREFKSIAAHKLIKPFIAEFHYLGDSMPRGCDKVFCLIVNNRLRGVAMFGEPAGRNCKVRYGQETIELRRFVLHPDLNGKNVGSWFMSKCLKKLQDFNVLTYSDPSHGHNGGIYKASNFEYLGKQRQGSTRVMFKGQPIFAQGVRAKRMENKQHVYMTKKDIWFYKKRG